MINVTLLLTPLNLGLIIIIEFLVLFLVSRTLKIRIIRFIYKTTKSQKAAIYGFSILFLPGTYLHEVAHFMFAQLLGVAVGEMELVPEISQSEIKLGSVKIAKTDFFRRFLIGAAPLILGFFIIFMGIFFSYKQALELNYWVIGAMGYLIFEIGNTLFSSKTDMESLGQVLIFFSLIFIIIIFLNNYFNLELINLFKINSISSYLVVIAIYLSVPIVIDLAAIFGIWGIGQLYDILYKSWR